MERAASEFELLQFRADAGTCTYNEESHMLSATDSPTVFVRVDRQLFIAKSGTH